jgi:2-polyprenyl-3-methyl-5-hydroxy-6-metoxy-1,4-benzoquinol methylase
LRPGQSRVLEVGCGDGNLARCLKKAGYDVVGLDKSPEATESASAKGLVTVCRDSKATP